MPRSKLLFVSPKKEGAVAFSRLFNGLSGVVLVCVCAQWLRRLNTHRGMKNSAFSCCCVERLWRCGAAVHDVGEWLMYALGLLVHP